MLRHLHPGPVLPFNNEPTAQVVIERQERMHLSFNTPITMLLQLVSI
jgi:hypothetical protein